MPVAFRICPGGFFYGACRCRFREQFFPVQDLLYLLDVYFLHVVEKGGPQAR